MSRPAPDVELAWVDLDGMETDVIFADAVWVVCYQGRPITVRRGPEGNRYPGFKYLKSAWPHPGHAFNMADRLNQMFSTEEFTVWEMKPHRQITEPKPEPRVHIERTWTPTKFSADEIVPAKGMKPRPLR